MVDSVQKWIREFEKPLTIFIGSICLTAVLLNLDFNFLEANLYDLRVSHGYQSKALSDIVLISLDDATTRELDEFAPLSMDWHSRFLETLEAFSPKAVGYLMDMNHVDQVTPELLRKEWGTRFVESAQRMTQKGNVFLLGTPFDVTGEIPPPFPLNTLQHSIAVVHKDGNVFAEDKITRRALLTLNDHPAFHLNMARLLGRIEKDELPRGTFYIPEVDGKYFFFRYHGSTVFNYRRPSPLPYPHYSFVDIIKKRVPVSALRNKVVLVSSLSSDDSADYAFTPYSRVSFSNPKLLVHANILDTIITRDGILLAPRWVNWLVTFVVTTFVLWWIMTATPLYGVFATLSLALALIVVSQALFQIRGLWLRESQPLVGIFVGYYLAVPYRLILEYKKRWDYQRKNEILTQVEELKTNFLHLVTHDLKTPVARIQGLTEVLLRNASNRLNPRDQETLKSVITSTEELNHFITSILELSKVESKNLHIQLESKDINHLIEKAVERFHAQAKARQVQLVSQLDPLFPIHVDPTLISKVLNNLIDNAIKYSPKNSAVHIESKEEGDWIVISIRDQGIGLSEEELQNLFTRFYRAKNDTTISTTGTGLGLYLTKYFIEAHQGHVEVSSEKNQGSTFRIILPMYPVEVSPNTIHKLKETFDV